MIRRRTTGRSEDGFSLVEVVVAIAIVAIGMTSTLSMLAFAVRSNTSSRARGTALYLANQQIEKVRAWPAYLNQTDDYDSSNYGVHGIDLENDALFEGEEGTDWFGASQYVQENNLKVNWSTTTFRRRTWIQQNGYFQTDCDGVVFKGTSGPGIFNEGRIYSYYEDGYLTSSDFSDESQQPSLNQNARANWTELGYDPDCDSKYRGPDFKLVRVEVSWTDVFSQGSRHTVVRDLFIPPH